MAITVKVSARQNGGMTITVGATEYQTRAERITYFANAGSISIWAPEMEGVRRTTTFPPLYIPPGEWEVGGVSNYTTVAQVCDALDTLIRANFFLVPPLLLDY